MNNKILPLAVSLFTAVSTYSPSILAQSADVEAALALLRQMQPDQCALQKVRGQLLVAHRAHDQGTLDALAPQVDVLMQRLKPAEAKLQLLTAAIKQNPQDQSAYTSAQIEASRCR